jgi:DNA-binding SARP family transcriptional activator/DNA-binding beta-propeller fold protein YncE
MPLEFRMLGPLEVIRDGRPLRLGGERQRALLALLLLDANRPVSSDRLIDALFGPEALDTASNALQVAVSRLRRLLGEDVLLTRPRGYELCVGPGQLDLELFERLAGEGRAALEAGDALAAAARLRDALALWRGRPLADLSGLDVAQAEIRRIEELQLAAVMDRVDSDLALGRGQELVPELETLAAGNPLQERLRGQLMLALYRAGRQADALAVYRSTRELLADELGLEPSRAMRDLERAILEHDPALLPQADVPAEPAAPVHRRRRWPLAVALTAAGAAALGTVLGLRSGGQSTVPVKPGSIVRIDLGSNRIVESLPVGREPQAMVADDDAVWVASERDQTLTRVDLHTKANQTIGGVTAPTYLVRDSSGNVYASAFDYPWVWRIDPRTAHVVARYRVRTRALDMAVSGGSLWVVDRLANSVDRIDLAHRRIQDVIKVGADPIVLTAGYGAVWVANTDDGSISVIRPGVRGTETIDGVGKVIGIAAGEGAIWASNNLDGTVIRINPDTRRPVAIIDAGPRPPGSSALFDVAVGAGSVWVVDRLAREVVRIDPRTNRVVARIRFPAGAAPTSVDATGDSVWVSVGTPGASL